MATRDKPDHVRIDNGSELTATTLWEWLGTVGVYDAPLWARQPWRPST